jgi:XRE family transcriptional regulator of biofilm formation
VYFVIMVDIYNTKEFSGRCGGEILKIEGIGERIHLSRVEQGLSISELAKKADVAKSYLSNVERSIKTNPSVQFVEKVAQALGVPVDQLLYERAAKTEGNDFDPDWQQLVQEAMASGISKSQFKEFLELLRKWQSGDGGN